MKSILVTRPEMAEKMSKSSSERTPLPSWEALEQANDWTELLLQPQLPQGRLFEVPVTICVSLYGSGTPYHTACLAGLRQYTQRERYELRIAANNVSAESLAYAKQLQPDVLEHWQEPLGKCQIMRKLWHDLRRPLTTPWVCWLDDMAFVRHSGWFDSLQAALVAAQDVGDVGCLGFKLAHQLPVDGSHDPRRWFEQGSWYRGKHWLDKHGQPAPHGSYIHYPQGQFFSVRTEAIEQADLPDIRLRQRGAGIVIGAQLHQNDYRVRMFDAEKQHVLFDAHARRGIRDQYPWLAAGTAG